MVPERRLVVRPDRSAPPGSTPVRLLAADGAALCARSYAPRGRTRFDLLMLPGIGVPQRVFRHVGAWFARQGVRALSVDYRGMGESSSDRLALETASLSTWASLDAVCALRYLEQSGGGAPIVLLAHSFGGQALGFSDEFKRLRAAILVGSQFGQARHWDGFDRLKIAAYWNLILPVSAAMFEVVPKWAGLGEALPRGVAREWALWGRSPEWLLSHVPEANARYASFDRPIRAYAVADDDIAPSRAVDALLACFRAASVERVDVAPADLGLPAIGHLGLFRRAAAPFWPEFLKFGLLHAARNP